jgi:hypothetical protein
MTHLNDNNMGYFTHWKRAMEMSIALFIHAWIPDIFKTYASERMKE